MSGPVAIIGAGPGGIAAARWLKSQGFAPTIFDRHTEFGGQWCPDNPDSGVWPQMVTNTYLEATRFSDQSWPEGTPLFPHNRAVRAYLQSYAARFGLDQTARFQHVLIQLQRDVKGYRLSFDTPDGPVQVSYPRVVIATGRFNKPVIPAIAGAERFTGKRGIVHSFNYKEPALYRDCHVIVAGGSISSLEIASDLAMLGAASVHLSQRRQRYVNPKMVVGVPLEYFAFTYRRGRMALDPDKAALARDDEALVMRFGGNPSRYGTPSPHPNFRKAGVTGSQHYLNLVAEGRLKPVPWMAHIDGDQVTFEDGTSISADGVIFGTGFALNLPFLSDEISEVVRNDNAGLELAEFTFHPDLPGLAFVGLWSQMGSYPTPLEQQARYLAYTWGGVLPHRSDTDWRQAVEASVTDGHHVGYRRQNEMALRFARLCGTDPASIGDPDLMERIEASAVTSTMFRLTGPDALPEASAEIVAQTDRYGPPKDRRWPQ